MGPLRGANHAYHGAPPCGLPRGIDCVDVIGFAASPRGDRIQETGGVEGSGWRVRA
jgi:hypothetical protein